MFFINCIIEVWESSYDDEVLDPYTKQSKKTYELVHKIPASFQNNTNSDEQKEHGKIRTTTYKVYVTLHKDLINPESIIRIQGEPQEYSIAGKPEWYNHLIPHTKLELNTLQENRLP